jgi:hypothetical protein
VKAVKAEVECEKNAEKAVEAGKAVKREADKAVGEEEDAGAKKAVKRGGSGLMLASGRLP